VSMLARSSSDGPRMGGPNRDRKRSRRYAAPAASLGMALLISACGSTTSPSSSKPTSTAKPSSSTSTTVVENTGVCKPGATSLTFWAWVPGIVRAVKEFNVTHPSICVHLEDVGAGPPEYDKLVDAAKAGSGEPDVAEVEYDVLPSYEITKSVLNLAKYGANKYKSDFVPWVWKEVSKGSAVYAMPGDSGPIALYYNSKQFSKYGLSVPTTWSQFAADAATLHKADPKAYMTNFAATDLQWLVALMTQDNADPFKYSGGSSVTIDFTGPNQMSFADYWQKLLEAHEVNATTDTDALSYGDLNSGVDASWLSSAWGPSYFVADATKASLGDWRAAPLPQWPDGHGAANWGGSSYPVFSQSKHPAQAAEFSEWLNGSLASWKILETAPSSLFPTFKPLLDSPAFLELTNPLSGSTHPNKVFAAAAAGLKAVEWPPFMTEALTLATTDFEGVLRGSETLPAAFKTYQSKLVSYAIGQGFKVTQ
jgi:multiple sugar transport system substrate-binding protein